EVGIAFELAGRFESDVAIAHDGFEAPGFHREGLLYFGRASRKSFGRAGSVRFVIHNGGPATAPGATFALDLDGDARITFLSRPAAREPPDSRSRDRVERWLPEARLRTVRSGLSLGRPISLQRGGFPQAAPPPFRPRGASFEGYCGRGPVPTPFSGGRKCVVTT